MKRISLAAVAIAVVVSAVAAIPSSSATPGAKTLKFIGITTSQTLVDNPPTSTAAAPFSRGDIVLFTDKLVAHGHTVGTNRGTCTAVDVPNFVCSVVFRLSGGTISVVGNFDAVTPKPQHLAVVGGTGAYRAARGEVTSTTVTDTKTKFVVEITR